MPAYTSFTRPVRVAMIALTLLGSPPVISVASGPADDPVAELSKVLYVQPVAADAAGPALFRSLYWLRMATSLNDLSPEAALRAAWQRANHGSGPALYQDQFLADWHIACIYGLFTPENLARLQAGTAPVATEGPFVGQTISARKILPAGRFAGIEGFALGPENGPLAKDAVPITRFRPPETAYLPPRASNTPSPRSAAPAAPGQLASNTLTFPPRPNPGAHRDIPMQLSGTPSPVVPAADSAAARAHVLLQDVPFNGLLPMEGKTKLGIAGVTSSEISVSIVGERQVLIKAGSTYGSRDTLYPSVDNYKVPKANPVRLPGVSYDAYLIKDDHSARSGVEVRYYYIDTSINNGTTFRIAKIVGDR